MQPQKKKKTRLKSDNCPRAEPGIDKLHKQ